MFTKLNSPVEAADEVVLFSLVYAAESGISQMACLCSLFFHYSNGVASMTTTGQLCNSIVFTSSTKAKLVRRRASAVFSIRSFPPTPDARRAPDQHTRFGAVVRSPVQEDRHMLEYSIRTHSNLAETDSILLTRYRCQFLWQCSSPLALPECIGLLSQLSLSGQNRQDCFLLTKRLLSWSSCCCCARGCTRDLY